MKFKLLLLTFSALLATSWAIASDGPPRDGETEVKKTDVVGGVMHSETKKPLNSVTITAYSAQKKEKVVQSDANGNFSFDDLRPGTYKFVFEKQGFKKVTREKTIVRVDEGHQLNIMMEEHVAFDFTPSPSHFFDFAED
jgi:hypothetical protein